MDVVGTVSQMISPPEKLTFGKYKVSVEQQ